MAGKMNFRTLLKIETFLCFLMTAVFFSFNITGMAISNSSKSTAENISAYFLILGVIGLAGLVFTKKKAE